MATEGIGTNPLAGAYSYGYTAPRESEKKELTTEVKEPKPAEVQKEAKKEPETTKYTDVAPKEGDVAGSSSQKSIYEESLTEEERKREEERRAREKQLREEELRALMDDLNKQMSSFSDKIVFEIGDKADSMIVKVLEENNEKKIKELSKEDAEKLFKRLDYVLGVLFDSRG